MQNCVALSITKVEHVTLAKASKQTIHLICYACHKYETISCHEVVNLNCDNWNVLHLVVNQIIYKRINKIDIYKKKFLFSGKTNQFYVKLNQGYVKSSQPFYIISNINLA